MKSDLQLYGLSRQIGSQYAGASWQVGAQSALHCTTFGSAEGASCRDEHSEAVRSVHFTPCGLWVHKSPGMPCLRHESGSNLSLMLHHDICHDTDNKINRFNEVLIEQ